MNADGGAPAFVDTNVLVYALANDDARRSPPAVALIRGLTESGALRTSTQVLAELFVTVTRKGRARVTTEEALDYLDQIATCPVVLLDFPAIRAAVELASTAKLSFWDALIIVAASRCGALRLYTEDLQHGRKILGVEIVNPFR